MKTSVKLLLGLLLGLIVAMFGAAISISHQLDKLDKKDAYAQWKKTPLSAFRAIHITGPSPAVVQIEPGPAPRLVINPQNDPEETTYTYRVERDTLFLHLNPVVSSDYLDAYYTWNDLQREWEDPQIVVQLPGLTAVSTNQARCQIRQLSGDSLAVNQQGQEGYILLDKLVVGQLNASLSGHSRLVVFGSGSQIGRGIFAVRDKAQLFQYAAYPQGLTITADSTAQLHLMGKSFQQMRQ